MRDRCDISLFFKGEEKILYKEYRFKKSVTTTHPGVLSFCQPRVWQLQLFLVREDISIFLQDKVTDQCHIKNRLYSSAEHKSNSFSCRLYSCLQWIDAYSGVNLTILHVNFARSICFQLKITVQMHAILYAPCCILCSRNRKSLSPANFYAILPES